MAILQPTHPLGFWVLLGFELYWVFQMFLFERAIEKLVGWLSFYLDSPLLY